MVFLALFSSCPLSFELLTFMYLGKVANMAIDFIDKLSTLVTNILHHSHIYIICGSEGTIYILSTFIGGY